MWEAFPTIAFCFRRPRIEQCTLTVLRGSNHTRAMRDKILYLNISSSVSRKKNSSWLVDLIVFPSFYYSQVLKCFWTFSITKFSAAKLPTAFLSVVINLILMRECTGLVGAEWDSPFFLFFSQNFDFKEIIYCFLLNIFLFCSNHV